VSCLACGPKSPWTDQPGLEQYGRQPTVNRQSSVDRGPSVFSTSCQLPVARVCTGFEARKQGSNVVANLSLPVASCQLPVASCQLPVASCQSLYRIRSEEARKRGSNVVANLSLPVASCQLPVASCQLPESVQDSKRGSEEARKRGSNVVANLPRPWTINRGPSTGDHQPSTVLAIDVSSVVANPPEAGYSKISSCDTLLRRS
jgi:hypothetical protein